MSEKSKSISSQATSIVVDEPELLAVVVEVLDAVVEVLSPVETVSIESLAEFEVSAAVEVPVVAVVVDDPEELEVMPSETEKPPEMETPVSPVAPLSPLVQASAANPTTTTATPTLDPSPCTAPIVRPYEFDAQRPVLAIGTQMTDNVHLRSAPPSVRTCKCTQFCAAQACVARSGAVDERGDDPGEPGPKLICGTLIEPAHPGDMIAAGARRADLDRTGSTRPYNEITRRGTRVRRTRHDPALRGEIAEPPVALGDRTINITHRFI